jgi:ABC-2 type transport system permease protein
MSKAFIFMTFIMPVLMFGFFGLQALMMSFQDDKDTKIEVVTESRDLTEDCKKSFNKLPFVEDGSWTLTYNTVSQKDIEEYIDSKKGDLLSKELTGIIFIPQKALEDKGVEYYARIPNKLTVSVKMNGPVNKILIDRYFKGKAVTDEELAFARKSVQFNNFKVTKEEKIEKQAYGNIILAFVFAILLYMSLMISGSMTMTAVIEEKASKVIEVLLSSVNSRELMAGKVLGNSITALAQMIIWLLPMIVLMSTTWIVLPDKFKFDIGYGHLIYFLFNFVLGLLIYQGLFAMVGAMFNTPQEAQQGAFPVIFLILIPFFISFSMVDNPDNIIAVIASYFPFAAIIVMPCRFTLVDISFIYPLISCIINITTLALIFPIAGKIYRVGILRTGTKPTLREVIRWVKAKE